MRLHRRGCTGRLSLHQETRIPHQPHRHLPRASARSPLVRSWPSTDRGGDPLVGPIVMGVQLTPILEAPTISPRTQCPLESEKSHNRKLSVYGLDHLIMQNRSEIKKTKTADEIAAMSATPSV